MLKILLALSQRLIRPLFLFKRTAHLGRIPLRLDTAFSFQFRLLTLRFFGLIKRRVDLLD